MGTKHNKEHLGFCVVCNEVKQVISFKGMSTCMECVLREANPPTVDEFIYNRDGSDCPTPSVIQYCE